jgi:hypothetical protein
MEYEKTKFDEFLQTQRGEEDFFLSFNIWLLNYPFGIFKLFILHRTVKKKDAEWFWQDEAPKGKKKEANTFFQISQHKGKCETIMQIPTRIPLKTRGEHMCFGRVNISCFSSSACRVTLVTNLVINSWCEREMSDDSIVVYLEVI